VLNNTSTANLAQQAAQRFESGGWTITMYGDYQNDISSTCAYYDPAQPGAKAAAEALQAQYPEIKRVEPRFTPDAGSQPLPTGPVVVVLTSDYSAA
jgi:LytR cell envelope-related transcriptional attenuator